MLIWQDFSESQMEAWYTYQEGRQKKNTYIEIIQGNETNGIYFLKEIGSRNSRS